MAVRFALAGGASLAFCALARRAGSLSARRPRRARAAGRLPLRRLLHLRLPRRALRSLGAGRGRLLGVAAPHRPRRGGAVRRRASAAASSSAACSGWPASRSSSGPRSRAPSGGERGTLGARVHRRRGAALGDRQPGREPQPRPRRAAPAGDGLRHALRRGRRAAIVGLALGRGFALPDGAELVAVARLPGARRLGAGLRLLPDPAGSASAPARRARSA